MEQQILVSEERRNNKSEGEFQRQKIEQQTVRAEEFRKVGLASLIYAVIFTICLYENLEGIAVCLWTAASAVYIAYTVNSYGKRLKKDSSFLMAVMLLLGVATFCTGNPYMICLNYLAVFILIVSLLLHNFYDDVTWDFGKYIEEITVAAFGAVSRVGRPFGDCASFIAKKQGKPESRTRTIILGVCIAVPCIALLGGLLAAADMVFADMISKMFANLSVPSRAIEIILMLVFGFLSSYCGVSYVSARTRKEFLEKTDHGDPVLAITVTAMIAALYVAFCAIQIVYLFLGNGNLPEGITYAQYARHGFFQLLFICVLNLILVLTIKKYFRENHMLNVILLLLSVCTFIMTASSAYRMILYIRAYYLTFLRAFVLVALFTIAVLMAGVLVFVLKKEFPLVKYGVVAVSTIYLVFSFCHIDAIIAKYNLTRVENTPETVDYEYIACLSTDAASIIHDYLSQNPETANVILEYSGDSWVDTYLEYNRAAFEKRSFRKLNRSYDTARKLFAEQSEGKSF